MLDSSVGGGGGSGNTNATAPNTCLSAMPSALNASPHQDLVRDSLTDPHQCVHEVLMTLDSKLLGRLTTMMHEEQSTVVTTTATAVAGSPGGGGGGGSGVGVGPTNLTMLTTMGMTTSSATKTITTSTMGTTGTTGTGTQHKRPGAANTYLNTVSSIGCFSYDFLFNYSFSVLI